MNRSEEFTPFQNKEVEDVFNSYPLKIREKLLLLRELIFNTASSLSEVGPLEEALRWEVPSYMTTSTKSGSMIRVHHSPDKPFDFAMYFLCNTTLVKTFKSLYPKVFRFGGNRSIEFMLSDTLLIDQLKVCIKIALTYNLNKKEVEK
ncbi:MAG: DUF1801 domain-containing protein [Candidatus Margulisbacteria bacterium]|nr:DUF1801 domain-containing protein [Candidatus Margulisiibacteriota bacterium]